MCRNALAAPGRGPGIPDQGSTSSRSRYPPSPTSVLALPASKPALSGWTLRRPRTHLERSRPRGRRLGGAGFQTRPGDGRRGRDRRTGVTVRRLPRGASGLEPFRMVAPTRFAGPGSGRAGPGAQLIADHVFNHLSDTQQERQSVSLRYLRSERIVPAAHENRLLAKSSEKGLVERCAA